AMTAACTAGSTNTTGREWISNVTVGAEGGQTMSGDSGASTYSDYTMDAARQITLYANSANNTISVSKAWASTKYNEGIVVWIDFNRSGTFEANEIILQSPSNQDTPITTTFAVPATSYIGDKPVRMRVNMRFNSNVANACGNFTFGEVEDYAVYIPSVLAVSENTKDSQIQVYPNPAKDVLNISKVSDRATYVIHSVSGQLISKGNISDGKVNVSKLQKGVYVISIDDSGNKTNVKFVKE
ncbi:MAG: T9SS type A sorting domain-containing protein, partial [Flavobacteriaceae bacterium]|nr:T9SS type A sorting domain-containing protein [Flavobacteriaceae bacterium]